MMGFEMAYIPVGQYYIASAQQVIAEEHRGKLTEKSEKNDFYVQATIGETAAATVEDRKEHLIVRFPFDSYIPYEKAKLKEDLRQYRGMNVSVTGYASPEGPKSYNKRLSKKRAEKVAKIAEKLGVNVSSINAVGEIQCGGKKQHPKCRKVEVVPLAEGENP
ncbi:hypothetical protein E0765_03615 [Sulfuricurvum sp. IAE1]|uniref:OmpA family protein n=1 Tax=Sulfuricurvum sp. IAE1 TaxID=2546102 RepID=UPI001049F668|nr:OmpA family protein [Sulfuricurvum sp. IAE1]TDA67321.1 hypothetical protein E0765_03615 [Sulfuricurvum sp. IAE1]